jgi:peroxiredoxin
MANRERYCLLVNNLTLIVIVIILLALAVAYWWFRRAGRSVPDLIQRGRPLPDFAAVDENGDPVRSTELHGTAAVMLFVRGNWCPFCSSQVRDLSRHYTDIVDLGTRLILVTPKPLQTTRRVAEFFNVEFDFWLDADLTATRALGLLHSSAVPDDYEVEYGEDTVWPTALVIDPNGVIRYVELSKFIADRPNPRKLLQELRKALDH